MKISRHIYDFCNRLLLPAVVGVLAVSCIDDSSLCLEDQPDFDPADNVWLSLEVKNQGVAGIDRAATRAGNINDPDASGHPSEEASEAENYINPQDLTLVFFDANGRAMKTLSNDELNFTFFDATSGNYKVVAQVNRAYFTFAAGKMSILAVANAHGINNPSLSADDYKAVPWQISLPELTSRLRKFQYSGELENPNFDQSQTSDPNYKETRTIGWMPDIDAGRHIPMAGYQTEIILNEEKLKELDAATTSENAFELPEIVMQRSMAKIRVLDGIQLQTGLRHKTEIISVDFRNGTEYGAIVPDVNQPGMTRWGIDGTTIVETATKPETTGSWHSPKITFPFVNLPDKFTVKESDNVSRDVSQWICYSPEMQVKGVTDDKQFKPYLFFNLKLDDGTSQSRQIFIEDIIDRSDIVRNHIYQFYVTMNEFSSELEVNVLDWDKNEETWDYTENPGVDSEGNLRWTTGFQSINYNTATGYFNADYTQAATGTFIIKTPLGGTWRASLITLSGEQHSFVFIDEEGNEVETVSGFIDGKQASITVKPKNAPGSEMNSARVQFTVTTVDNRTMIIDMVDGPPYTGDRHFFTIVQNPSL